MEDHFRDLYARHSIREIAFDPTYRRHMMSSLGEDGFPVIGFRQGWVTMASAVKELALAILGRRVWYGAHPVLHGDFSNIQLRIEPANDRPFHKVKSDDKIDGAVAAAMAVAGAAADASGVITSAEWFLDDKFLA